MKRARGFTLVEMLVVVAIFGGIMGALLISFLVGKSSYLSADAYIQVQQETRRAFDNMVKELREAGGTITPADVTSTSLTFQVALGYNLAAPCPVNAVCWGAQDQNGANQPGWSIRYRVNGTQLVRELHNEIPPIDPPVATRVLANNANSGLAADGLPATSWRYDSGTKVVNMRLEVRQVSGQLPGGSMSTSPPAPLRTQVRLRNTS